MSIRNSQTFTVVDTYAHIDSSDVLYLVRIMLERGIHTAQLE